MKKEIFIFLIGLLANPILFGQCLPENSLWKRLVFLRDNYNISSEEKLNELLLYEPMIKNCPYRYDSTHAFLLQRIGMAYFGKADFLKAVEYLRQSVSINNSGKPSTQLHHNILGYFYLSAAYDSLKNIGNKMQALDSCIQIAGTLKDYSDISCIRSMYSRIEYFFNAGDYHRCIDYATMCEKSAWQYANDHKSNPWEYSTGAAHASSSLAWNIEALIKLRDFQTAEELLLNKLNDYKKSGLRNYLGVTCDQLAHIQMYKGDYNKALYFLKEQLKYDKESGYLFNCKQALNTIGHDIYFSFLKDNNSALKYYRLALTYVNKDGSFSVEDSMESLNIFNRIANAYLLKKFYDSAFKFFQLAFNQIQPGLDEESILRLPSNKILALKKIDFVSTLLIDKGNALKEIYMVTGKANLLQKAIRTYKKADAFLDTIKNGIIDLQSKLFWRRDARRLYENAIQACFLQKNMDDAFYFFEKSRAALLQDQLNELHWYGENDILKQAQLQKQILHLQREVGGINKSSPKYSELQNETFAKEQELERLKNLIRTTDPLYYQNFVDRSFIQMKDVRDKILKDHQALVELFSGDSAVYILVITQQKADLQKINKTDFDRLSDTYRNFISNADLLNRNFETFKKVSLQLYQLLFQNSSLPAGRIIISPEGKNFPFEALITNTKPFTYFLDDHAVSYTYSARYLLNQFTANSISGSGAFIGIAPVHYANGFASLSGSDKSLRQVQGYFNNPVNLTGNDASKNNFLKQYFKYKIIQLYTHATDSGYSGEPMIYFSDSAMLLSDLFYESKPTTDLIVLSACETAAGKLYNGEGVFSFNRQFAALGIPSSISNLWQADDQSTYRITELFYKYLSEGMALDEALQKAKKEFKTTSTGEKELPYYWAAPILVGQTDPISLQKPFPWWAVAVFCIVTVFAFWVWRSKSALSLR